VIDLRQGHALELIEQLEEAPDLIATDPPYAFGGSGDESKRHPAYHDSRVGLDHITAPPLIKGRRAQLPPEVAAWMVQPFAVTRGLLLDPFAGSGAILRAGESFGMRTIGFELSPSGDEASGVSIQQLLNDLRSDAVPPGEQEPR
jgi:DNA modification methylase